jgi:hypothetical protein
MAIELTTAPLSAQIGINNTLRQTFASGVPLLDGFTPNGHIYCFCNALEGSTVPDGESETYTKTYNLSAEIPFGYVIFIANSGSWAINNVISNLELRSTVFGKLTGINDNGAGTLITASVFDTFTTGLYVTQDYTQTRRLINSSSSATGRDRREDGTNFPNTTFLKTYTELGNTILGYYSGISNIGIIQKDAKSALKSAWLSNGSLVMSFKKFAATSGATFNNEQFCVFW